MKHREQLEQILDDVESLRQSHADPEAGMVLAALLAEDLFDIHLVDDDIDAALLTRPGLRAVATRDQKLT